MSVRVLVADDQALVRAGFRKILEADTGIEVVGQAADGLEAVDRARALLPDVVLMDIRMPGLDGIAATRQLADKWKNGPRVLVLTTFGLQEYVYEALRAGALECREGTRRCHLSASEDVSRIAAAPRRL